MKHSSAHRPPVAVSNQSTHRPTPSTSSGSSRPSQPLPPASGKINATHPIFTSSTTAGSSRALGPTSASTTSAQQDASRAKLFRITPGPSQLRVILPSEVVVVPDSEDELEDTEKDEGIPDLSKALGHLRSSSRTEVDPSYSGASSRTKTTPGVPRRSTSPHKRKRSSHATTSISSRSKPVKPSRHSRPSSSHHRGSGTSSKPIDLCETSSSESIVLLTSPPNTLRSPISGMSHPRDGKDKVDRAGPSHGHKIATSRSSAFGSHARKVDGKIIPPSNINTLIHSREQGQGDAGRVRTVAGKDTTLSSTQKHSSSEARRSASFTSKPSTTPTNPRNDDSYYGLQPSASASSSKPRQSDQKRSRYEILTQVATLYTRVPSGPPPQSVGHPSSQRNSPSPVKSTSDSSTPRPSNDPHRSSYHAPRQASSSRVLTPSSQMPDFWDALSIGDTPQPSVPKGRDPQTFPMQGSSAGPSRVPPASISRTPQNQPRRDIPHMPGGYPTSTFGPHSTSSRPSTPASKDADVHRRQAIPHASSPRQSHREPITSKRFPMTRSKVAPPPPTPALTRAEPDPVKPTSRHDSTPEHQQRPKSSAKNATHPVSARPATSSSSRRLPTSPLKRRRESRFEEEESYQPRNWSQALPESPENSRPKRARPEQGRYTIPTLDAEQWPTKSGTYGSKTTKRAAGQKSSQVPASSNTPAASASARPSSMRRSSSLSSAPPTSQSPVARPRTLDPTSSLTVLSTSSQSPAKSTKTVTPRQSHFNLQRSSPLSPPEEVEEEEPVEEEKVGEPMDLLADFEDFQFEPESPKTARSLPGSQARILVTPEQSSLEDVFYTPKSRPSASNPRTLSRRATDKSPLSASRKLQSPRQPQPIAISPKYVKIALSAHPHSPTIARAKIDAILAAAERKATEERELMQKQREERQRQMAEYTAKVEVEEEEEEEKIEDLGDVLDTVKEERRQSVRLRSASASTDIDVKPKPTLGKRRVPSDFDRLMRENKRNERRGVSGPQAEAMLAAIGESLDGEEEVPYPTPPISGDGEEEDETLDSSETRRPRPSRQISGISLKAALGNVPEGLIDDQFMRGMAEDEEKEESEEVEQRRPTIWTRPQVRSEVPFEMPELELEGVGGPVADMLEGLCRDSNVHTLGLCLSTGVFDSLLASASNAQRLFDWLLQSALGDASASRLDSIRPAFLYLLQKYNPVAVDFILNKRSNTLFASMGAGSAALQQDKVSGTESHTIRIDRKLAASLICELVIALPALKAGHRKEIAAAAAESVLLFHDLAVDHSTSKPLQYLAQQAAQRLIVIAGEADRTEAISLLAKEPETDADDLAPRPFSLDDVDLPTLTGTSSRHQEVVAWTSCALLGDRNSEQATPFPMIADLMPLAADIFHALNVRRTDHGKLARMIELFAATLGGLNDFIERCGEAYEVPTKGLEECNREFGQLRDVIGSGFRRFPVQMANGTGGRNKTRLGQIHVNLGIQYTLATKRWERQRVARMRGLRQAEGGARQSGQLRLDFAPKD